MEMNPYTFHSGPVLDSLVHQEVLGLSGPPDSYSTDERAAEKAYRHLRASLGRKLKCGHSHIRGKPWFARNENDANGGTEVLAETYALAICRLAPLTKGK